MGVTVVRGEQIKDSSVSLTVDVTGTLPVANGGTGVTSSTGSGSVVLSASPSLSGTVAGTYTLGGTPTFPSDVVRTASSSNILPTGSVVQCVSTNFSAVATGTTVIPYDDTIPQITEGDEYMTISITPKATTNKLVIDALFQGSFSVVTDMSIALFQNSTASALAADAVSLDSANFRRQVLLRHTMTTGTTSAITFRIRAGGSGAGTMTFNGTGAARKLGGITGSNITVTEYKV